MPPPSARSLLLPSPSPSAARLPAASSLRKAPSFVLTPNHYPSLRLCLPSRRHTRCSVVSVEEASSAAAITAVPARPSPAEVSRTIVELSSTGTLSAVSPEGWPLGVGARFVVGSDGSPALCLKNPKGRFSIGGKSSFHVQLEQSGSRMTQCTLLGSLTKPEDRLLLKKLSTKWEKRFGEELEENLVYLVAVERVLCMEDIKEDGTWVTSLEYGNAEPDPLRNCAEKIVDEMNAKHSEDVQRLCNIHVDAEFQANTSHGELTEIIKVFERYPLERCPHLVCSIPFAVMKKKVLDTKMIWVDRLGFDLYLYSEKEVFEARIPFPREVADEKVVKSTFNCMSHLAWEVEKNYALPESEKVRVLKKVRQIV